LRFDRRAVGGEEFTALTGKKLIKQPFKSCLNSISKNNNASFMPVNFVLQLILKEKNQILKFGR
jgi:hypothetical protein